MKRALAALALLAACSNVPDEEAVDWDDYPRDIRQQIAEARQDKDCSELLDISDQAKDSDFKDYVEDTLVQTGCYD